jgi:uncharacterized protein involved in type VI secretion and phage assembly
VSTGGVVVGVVVDVKDPDNQGRIKLKFPWLDAEATSGWAPIASPMSGKNRGYYYMPEVDDEALVAFEHGDVDHPMVVGFLHNGVDVPPDTGIDTHVRRLKTVSGHILEFDDRPGRESIRLTSSTGHKLEMTDVPGEIKLSTTGGVSVTISDTGGVSLTAPTVAVTSPLTQFSGIVQCQTLITQAVVSASYTPGAGNLW